MGTVSKPVLKNSATLRLGPVPINLEKSGTECLIEFVVVTIIDDSASRASQFHQSCCTPHRTAQLCRAERLDREMRDSTEQRSVLAPLQSYLYRWDSAGG